MKNLILCTSLKRDVSWKATLNERKAWQSEKISMLFLHLGIEDSTEWRLYFEQTGRMGKKLK